MIFNPCSINFGLEGVIGLGNADFFFLEMQIWNQMNANPFDNEDNSYLDVLLLQLFRQRLSKKSVKAYATIPKGSLGNTQYILIRALNRFCFF